jgi:hypothetical protein
MRQDYNEKVFSCPFSIHPASILHGASIWGGAGSLWLIKSLLLASFERV